MLGEQTPQPNSRSCCLSSAASPVRRNRGTWGYSRCDTADEFAAQYEAAARDRALARACCPGSATRSSPTLTRKRTVCCTPTGRRSFRSRRSRAPRADRIRARRRDRSTRRGRAVGRRADEQARAAQAGRPRADCSTAATPIADVGRRRRLRPAPFAPNAHLRWHPLRGEWVAYATHRQNRTFLPPADYNPLAPTTDPAHPDRAAGAATTTSRCSKICFPTLTAAAHDPPALTVPTRAASAPARSSSSRSEPTRLARRAAAVAPRADCRGVGRPLPRARRARPDVAYVYAFENRGVEVGVTLQPSARPDLRVSVHAADSGARAGAASARSSRRTARR